MDELNILLPVSSTVIPIPIGYYQQLRAGLGVHRGKLTKQKMKLNKPTGPAKLITVSGLKKLAAHETIKPT
ncbi:hypothetical protein RUM43_008713 [Polyplax serrata]|uniref:Uncharacterized protein n=1 Tax=Polyplax serrata TaxID=468196 RepID=A0AAN8S861_POLSC